MAPHKITVDAGSSNILSLRGKIPLNFSMLTADMKGMGGGGGGQQIKFNSSSVTEVLNHPLKKEDIGIWGSDNLSPPQQQSAFFLSLQFPLPSTPKTEDTIAF